MGKGNRWEPWPDSRIAVRIAIEAGVIRKLLGDDAVLDDGHVRRMAVTVVRGEFTVEALAEIIDTGRAKMRDGSLHNGHLGHFVLDRWARWRDRRRRN